MASTWIAYNKLAWTEDLLADPASYEGEVAGYVALIERAASEPPATLLHNFAYTGEKDGVHVTLLENNYINPYCPDTCEATLVYLIRRRGELSIHTDRHVLGLFAQATWDSEGLTWRPIHPASYPEHQASSGDRA